MKKLLYSPLLALVVLMVYQSVASAATSSLLVVPARYRVVKLAFDVAQLRDVTLVSYRTGKTSAEPLLFVWSGSQWNSISLDQYRSGSFMGSSPAQVVVVGNEKDISNPLSTAASEVAVKRVEKIDVATVVADLDRVLNFTAAEWRTLAQRNELQIEDVNAERRHYGRYGKPGQPKAEKSMPATMKTNAAPEIEATLLPPAASVPASTTATKATTHAGSQTVQSVEPTVEESVNIAKPASMTEPAAVIPANK